MGKKIYIGNLSFDVETDQLSDLFKSYGTVTSANIIKDRYTGRSKGFAFVEMSQDSEAMSAIDGLNGKDVSGRALKISEAKPQESSDRSSNSFGSSRRY